MFVIKVFIVIVVLLSALSIVWYTIITGISPMMSSSKACQAMLSAIDLPVTGTITDLGSGWGTLVIAAARKHPNQTVIGYELSFIPWLISILRKRYYGLTNLTIYRQNAMLANLKDTSIIFCYLFPKGMENLHDKLQQEKSLPITVISNTFALPNTQPCEVIKLNDMYQTPIYIYAL